MSNKAKARPTNKTGAVSSQFIHKDQGRAFFDKKEVKENKLRDKLLDKYNDPYVRMKMLDYLDIPETLFTKKDIEALKGEKLVAFYEHVMKI